MSVDFLIIGGGIAGVSAAAELSALGKVVLLEAEGALAHHTSGRSAALYEKGYGKPAVRALTEASEDHLRHAHGGFLTPRGLLIVAPQDKRDAFATDVAQMGLTPISPADAIAMVPVLRPDYVAHAAHHDGAWDIDTDRLIQTYARTLRANGGHIILNARVAAIARDGAGWRVTAGGAEHYAATLVNAAGAWADGVARMAGVAPLGIIPHRRSMARIPAPGGHDVTRWPMLFGPGEDWYAKPDAGALIVSPAEEDPMEPHDAWPDDMVLAEGLARYDAAVTEPVTRLIASWAGLRSFAPDRVLVIGRDAAVPGFVWLAGQGGYGFQSGPGAARLLADLIAGRGAEVDAATVAALSPARFG